MLWIDRLAAVCFVAGAVVLTFSRLALYLWLVGQGRKVSFMKARLPFYLEIEWNQLRKERGQRPINLLGITLAIILITVASAVVLFGHRDSSPGPTTSRPVHRMRSP